jgi:hypothetical protein
MDIIFHSHQHGVIGVELLQGIYNCNIKHVVICMIHKHFDPIWVLIHYT